MRTLLIALLLLAPLAAWAAPASPRARQPLFKGYELYSYRTPAGAWRYALLAGTNRNKSMDEVAAAPALTQAQLEQQMSVMAVGETISWTVANVTGGSTELRLERPPATVVRRLETVARGLGIHLSLP